MIEKCEVDKHTLHKACAKCSICSRKLTVGGIFIQDNKVLCSQHKQYNFFSFFNLKIYYFTFVWIFEILYVDINFRKDCFV